MEIIIGRQGNQPMPITDTSVSRKHCKLTSNLDGTFTLEDLGSSSGTFVNGQQIIKTNVTKDDTIQLGSNLKLKVADLVADKKADTPKVTPKPAGGGSPMPSGNMGVNGLKVGGNLSGLKGGPIQEGPTPQEIAKWKADFAKLEVVWEGYSRKKVELQKASAKANFLRMLPMTVIGAIMLLLNTLLSTNKGDGEGADVQMIMGMEPTALRIVISVVGVALMAFLTFRAFKSTSNVPEKMNALNEQFQIDYVCPKCKNFLGFTPFAGLKQKKQCDRCKIDWVD